MEVRETTLTFSVARGSGPMVANRTIVFARPVDKAVAAVRGYQVGFAGEDHHVGLLEVALDTAIDNINTQRGQLGAQQNRMESALRSIQIQRENLSASESRIPATPIWRSSFFLPGNGIVCAMPTVCLASENPSPPSTGQSSALKVSSGFVQSPA